MDHKPFSSIYTLSICPLLFLLDDHASHYNLMLQNLAAEGGVMLFCLLPHNTHLLQPLHNGAFTSLKDHWRSKCHRFCTQNSEKVLNCRSFMRVFQKAWMQEMTIFNVVACFHTADIYHVDKTVVLLQISVETTSSPYCSTAIYTLCTILHT